MTPNEQQTTNNQPPSSLWQTVVTTTLVGTERKSLTLTPSTDELGNLLSQLNYADPEGALLSAVAAICLYQKAGQLPIIDNQPLPEACQPDDQLSCNTSAAQHLWLILSEERNKLLAEWLAAAAATGKRAPEHCLPELLDLGRTSRQLRTLILSVLSQRGRWLAAQNPDWDYVVGEDIEETWVTGSLGARQLLLQHLRHQDPNAARERLVEVWEQEKSDERLAFLETFQTGLSMDDEPFLEAALDDRRQEVRRQAVQLLSQLPESRLCQRMADRVRLSLILKQKRHRLHIDFTPEAANDQSMSRDGIDLKQPPRLLGAKAWQILQIVAATPLQFWSEIQAEPAAEWIQAAKRSEWDRTLVDGWAVAALRQQNPDWAEALLPLHDTFHGYLVAPDKLIRGLIGVLPPERREAFFLKPLQSNSKPFDSKHPAFSLLCHCCYLWSPALTRAAIKSIQRYLTNIENPYDWVLRSALTTFAYFMNPSVAPELSASFSARIPESIQRSYFWAEAIDEFLALLNFRHEMLQELSELGTTELLNI